MIHWLTQRLPAAYAQAKFNVPANDYQPDSAGISGTGAGFGMSRLAGLVNHVVAIINDLQTRILELAGLIMVLMLIWGGIQYITNQADAGKKTITAAIVGGVIVAAAYAIIKLAFSLIQSS